MATVVTAFTMITGYLGRQFHVPLADNQVHQLGQKIAETACEHACARASKVACCYFGARRVDTFEDAVNERANRVAWEIEGRRNGFNAGPHLAFNLRNVGGNVWNIQVADPNLVVTIGAAAAVNIDMNRLPNVARDLDNFYALVVLKGTKLRIFDIEGELIQTFTIDEHKLEDLEQVAVAVAAGGPIIPPAHVAFVKSWVCGLFSKNVNLKSLKFHSNLGWGKLATCGAPIVETPAATESSVPVAIAKNKVLAGFAGDWDADLDVTRSGGVSLASILCAVFASVSLVLLVLLAKKKSHVEVPLVDDE